MLWMRQSQIDSFPDLSQKPAAGQPWLTPLSAVLSPGVEIHSFSLFVRFHGNGLIGFHMPCYIKPCHIW